MPLVSSHRWSTHALLGAWALLSVGTIAASAVAAPGEPSAVPKDTAGSGPRQASHYVPVASDRPPAARNAGAADSSRNTSPTRAEKTRLGEAPSRPNNSASGGAQRGTHGLGSTLGGLAGVIALFGAAAWFLRRSFPRTSQQLPNEVIEVLGLTGFGHRQQAQLVRLGKKLLLIHISAGHAETLTEVTDAAEVERLVALCRTTKKTTAPNFSDVLQQFRARPSNSLTQTGPTSKAAHPAARGEASDA